jgi:hypothetical protein
MKKVQFNCGFEAVKPLETVVTEFLPTPHPGSNKPIWGVRVRL